MWFPCQWREGLSNKINSSPVSEVPDFIFYLEKNTLRGTHLKTGQPPGFIEYFRISIHWKSTFFYVYWHNYTQLPYIGTDRGVKESGSLGVRTRPRAHPRGFPLGWSWRWSRTPCARWTIYSGQFHAEPGARPLPAQPVSLARHLCLPRLARKRTKVS